MIRELILQNRTCRRFHQEVTIERETLRALVDLARCSASGANMQPLKYILSCDPEKNALILKGEFFLESMRTQKVWEIERSYFLHLHISS